MFIQFLTNRQKNLVGNQRHHIHTDFNHDDVDHVDHYCHDSDHCKTF